MNKVGQGNKRALPIILYISIVSIFIITMFSFFYFRQKFFTIGLSKEVDYETYKKHYVMITSDTKSPFWEAVYQEARTEAKAYNAYVEYMGKNLSTPYDTKELLKIATNCNVDGIILEGDESEETTNLINKAVEKGIMVITVLKDNPKSKRQCFIGVNNYNLGKLYGEQVLALYKGEPERVLVLMDSGSSDTNQNIVYSSIKETIYEGLKESDTVELQAVSIRNDNRFSSEESIRDIIMDVKHLPSIMICLNDIDTKCAYQAVVDHNKVGEIDILGYYDSQDILAAIQKQIVHSTVAIDSKEMGSLCIWALEEYKTSGHVSSYLTADMEMITMKELDIYLQKMNEVGTTP
ncbi:hypothetical protein CS063_15840 [Sporanaerobium hydrogeniformans]|uniref:Uncharacterized protein n=1 Tax=Sporanaerobium hydrogeniformans TaxID=3072179 RepID=A0AC61D9R0_9FIRM|nr:substrate-binding domain-containing protein [Sporanaerobium hydrogeniformans]PHV69411.1 hypothetical protein CS063_15840 [Sporanaerobium hydrogeniformans]